MSAIYMNLQRRVCATSRGASVLVVLRVIAEAADHAGRTQLAVPEIARRAGCVMERQVQRIIGQCVAAGVLEREFSFAGGGEHGAQLPNTYRLLTTWVRKQIEHEKARLTDQAVKVTERVQRQAVKWFSRKVYRLADGREGCIHQIDPACDECRRQ